MGVCRPQVLVVSASFREHDQDLHWAEIAHARARAILEERDVRAAVDWVVAPLLENCLSGLQPPALNGHRSFAIFWNGSEEGWPQTDALNAALGEFRVWLREQCYEDGSSPLSWAWLRFDGDYHEEVVVDSSARQYRERRPVRSAALDAARSPNWA